MSDLTFGQYLKQQVAQKRKDEGRIWTQNELARRAHISSGHMSMIVNGKIQADVSTLKAIAKALNKPIEEVFNKAGVLPPPETDLSADVLELAREIDDLADAVKPIVIRTARGMLQGIQEAHASYIEGMEELMNEDVPLETLRELKEHDPETYYAFLEDRLGPNWRQIVEDFVSIQPVLDTLDEVDQAPSTEQPVSTRRQRG